MPSGSSRPSCAPSVWLAETTACAPRWASITSSHGRAPCRRSHGRVRAAASSSARSRPVAEQVEAPVHRAEPVAGGHDVERRLLGRQAHGAHQAHGAVGWRLDGVPHRQRAQREGDPRDRPRQPALERLVGRAGESQRRGPADHQRDRQAKVLRGRVAPRGHVDGLAVEEAPLRGCRHGGRGARTRTTACGRTGGRTPAWPTRPPHAARAERPGAATPRAGRRREARGSGCASGRPARPART